MQKALKVHSLIFCTCPFHVLACEGSNVLTFKDSTNAVEFAMSYVKTNMTESREETRDTYFLVKVNGDIIWRGERIGSISASSKAYLPPRYLGHEEALIDKKSLIDAIAFLSRNCIPAAFMDKRHDQFFFEYGDVG